MVIKGIAKGDKDLRHFTFDDEDYVVKGGVYFYKVNYGKNKLEGEYAEDEIGYVECDKVISLGGKRPRPIPGREVKKETPADVAETPQKETKAKKPRTAKTTKLNANTERLEVFTGPSTFEYKVDEIKASKIKDLEQQLNEKGQDGWEVCGMDTNKSLFGEIHIVVVLKRKRG